MHLPLHVDLDLFSQSPVHQVLPLTPMLTPPPYSDKPPSYRSGSVTERESDINNNHQRQTDVTSNSTGDESAPSNDAEPVVIEGNIYVGTNPATGQTPSQLSSVLPSNPSNSNGDGSNDPNQANKLSNIPIVPVNTHSELNRSDSQTTLQSSRRAGQQNSESCSDHSYHTGQLSTDSSRLGATAQENQIPSHGVFKKRDDHATNASLLPKRLQTKHASVSNTDNNVQLSQGTVDEQQRSSKRHPGTGRFEAGSKVQSNTHTTTCNSSISKPKGKSKRSKGNSGVVLRSYERNDQFDNGCQLQRF